MLYFLETDAVRPSLTTDSGKYGGGRRVPEIKDETGLRETSTPHTDVGTVFPKRKYNDDLIPIRDDFRSHAIREGILEKSSPRPIAHP
jgi:hypothetical protein